MFCNLQAIVTQFLSTSVTCNFDRKKKKITLFPIIFQELTYENYGILFLRLKCQFYCIVTEFGKIRLKLFEIYSSLHFQVELKCTCKPVVISIITIFYKVYFNGSFFLKFINHVFKLYFYLQFLLAVFEFNEFSVFCFVSFFLLAMI